jgi:RimJ/RimL family protein N-acetyltransferase
MSPSSSATKSKRKSKSKAKPKAKAAKKRTSRFSAKTADKHDLYQRSVQSPEEDIEFCNRVFKTLRKRKPLHYREDFCGTGLLSAKWIQQSKKHTAEGFDLDSDPVAWGLAHNFEPLGADAARYTVHLKDVRDKGHRPADIRTAQNFSYSVFHSRAELLSYFRAAREDLADDGLFIIDLHGGPEATEEMFEEKACGGFTYVWDQYAFYPGTGEYICHIHYKFPDKTEMKRAFTYKWRFWYMTELRDALLDAGFRDVHSYFEGTDEDGTSGDGIFRRGKRGENCLSWLAYLVAEK